MSLFPFPAVVGQEDVKEAIILNLINPAIGGVLIDGGCGTGKSILARSASVLTEMKFCELPANCSEDRLIGAIDIEKTMQTGKAVLEQGLLHRAKNGIVFADDIHILPENVADLLQSVLSNKEIRVERDGISDCQHSSFLLIATMNSQAGQIRKSLIDHFGLYARAQSVTDSTQRLEIMHRRFIYDDAPAGFCALWQEQVDSLRYVISRAQKLLPTVILSQDVLDAIVKKIKEASPEGHRADLVMFQTVKAVAAFHGRTHAVPDDVDEAAYFVMPHRRRLAAPQPPVEQEQQQEQEQQEPESPDENRNPDAERNEQESSGSDRNGSETSSARSRFKNIPKAFAVGDAFQVVPFAHKKDRKFRNGWGRRTQTKTEAASGRYIYPTIQRRNNDLALDATIRAAAPYQNVRPRNGMALSIRTEDIREKVRQKKVSNLLVFVVDASGSMGVSERMVEAKGAVLSLLKDAYVKRDKIAMVTFCGDGAQVVLPPTRSAERGYRLLQQVQTGGKTPLNAGITKALVVIQSQLRQQPDLMPMLIVITDGKGNISIDREKKPMQELMEIGEKVSKISQIDTMIIDIEKGGLMQFGIAKKLADAMNGKYCKLDQIKSHAIVDIVKKEQKS